MRYKTIALAAAVMLAFSSSGVIAASMANSPTTGTPLSADDAQPTDHTGDVVDPDNKLCSKEVEDAREIAWTNSDVRVHLEDIESPSLKVWAPTDQEDNVSVWIAENETGTNAGRC